MNRILNMTKRSLHISATGLVVIPSLISLYAVIALSLTSVAPQKTSAATTASSATPCVGSAAPTQWKHVVVLKFENHAYNQVIDTKDSSGNYVAPYITDLAHKCATSKSLWKDADWNVNGSKNGGYNSKPNYATLTSGVAPTVHGLKDDTYSTKTGVDNIYNQLRLNGKQGKDYFTWGGTGCSATGSGDYHDAIRYYTNIDATYCNSHDLAISQFMTDVNSGNLPDFSMILPTNCQNMHSCSSVADVVKNGDDWAKAFLPQFLDSAQYKSGDTALFFLWDEDNQGGQPIPNVLMAPSVQAGYQIPVPTTGNPISHYSALRTWLEMLNLPLIGDTAQAPSLLSTFNSPACGSNCTPTDPPPTVSISAPTNGATLNAGVVNVATNTSADAISVQFLVDGVVKATDTSAPFSYSWDASTLSGSHTLVAKVSDGVNPLVSSNTVTVNITPTSSCPSIPTPQSSGVITVNAAVAGTYRLWTRMNAPDSTNNSMYVKIDNDCPQVLGDSTSIPASQWSWVDYKDGNTSSKVDVNLAAGSHTITVMGREANVGVDKFLFLSSSSSCQPTSATGNECIDTTAPTVSVTSPTANASVSGNVTVSATASDSSGVAKVSFYIDNNPTPFAEDTTSPYSATWNSLTVPDGTHCIKVTATDTVGNVSQGNTVCIVSKNTDSSPPTTPGSLTTTKNTTSEVDLAWTASTDNVGVKGYNVYRNSTLVTANPINATSFPDTTVQANTGYIYQVEAVDAAGNVSPRAGIGVTTPAAVDTTPPSTPTSLTATVIPPIALNGTPVVNLSWTKSPEQDVNAYIIMRDGVAISFTTATQSTFTDSTVAGGKTCTYSVVARDTSNNDSKPSNSASAVVPPPPTTDITPPATPQQLVGYAITANEIWVAWLQSSDNAGGTGVGGYLVYRNGVQIANVTTLSFADATAQPGQTYTYTVAAYDNAGNKSALSVPATVTTKQSNSSVLLSDDFDSVNTAWQTVQGSWSIMEGAAPDTNQTLAQQAAGDAWTTNGQASWTDYAVEAKVRPNNIQNGDSRGFAAVYGRWKDNTHWYYALLRNSGTLELKLNNGNVYTVLASKNYAVTPGTWYKLKLDMVGSTLKVYVNDQLELTSTNNVIADGRVGLGTYDMSADFDDVLVTSTQAPQPVTLTLAPSDDAKIVKGSPSTNYGSSTALKADNSPVEDFLIKFNVNGVGTRTVKSAKLRMYNTNSSPVGGIFKRTADTSWGEKTITWSNAPAADAATIAALGSVTKGTYYEVDVTSAIAGDGTYSFRVSTTKADGTQYNSKESSTNKPELIINAQ